MCIYSRSSSPIPNSVSDTCGHPLSDSSKMFSAAENITFGVLSILAGCISTFSILVHLRAGNTGVILMILWCFLGLINKGVNALAFNHSLRLAWTFGCDVSAVIERCWQLGMCFSSFCILLKLESIASLRQNQFNSSDRKRRLFLDLTLGLGIPILQIPLFFIVQPYRLNVIENIGCSAPLYSSVPAIFVFHLWRLVASVLCAVFAGKFLSYGTSEAILTFAKSEQSSFSDGSCLGTDSSPLLCLLSIQDSLKRNTLGCSLLPSAKRLSSQLDSFISSSILSG